MKDFITIDKRKVGKGHPVYIIAEMSANHGQDFDIAVKIVEAAKLSGADAIKVQTFKPELHTIKSDKACFIVGSESLWGGKTLYDLYSEAYMPWDWQPRLQKVAVDLGLDFFSSVVDPVSLEFVESMDVPVHKIASFEIVDLPLIAKISKTGKPLIISTGMATLADIDQAVQTAKDAGASGLALLKCNSSYPAKPEEMNLITINNLSSIFHLPVGLSDHTLGIATAVASIPLGATIIEKHLTLSRQLKSHDSKFSLEPNEFRDMVDAIRITEKAIGKVRYGPTKDEEKSMIFRRSLFAVEDIKAGEKYTHTNIRSIRPGSGLHPKYLESIVGHECAVSIEKGTPITWELILRGKKQ